MPSLREEKKALTRAHIADCAAQLFGTHGYENVSVTDVAHAAQVSPQTVYNYFPTKADLILDREDELRDAIVAAVTSAPRGSSIAAAIQPVLSAELDLLGSRTAAQVTGDLPLLYALSPEIRRLTLDARDRQARAIATAMCDRNSQLHPVAASSLAWALVMILHALVELAGQQIETGRPPSDVAAVLRPELMAALNNLQELF